MNNTIKYTLTAANIIWSASRGQLQVPRIKLTTYGNRAFGHAGLSTWNALPNTLFTYFQTSSKTFALFTSKSIERVRGCYS